LGQPVFFVGWSIVDSCRKSNIDPNDGVEITCSKLLNGLTESTINPAFSKAGLMMRHVQPFADDFYFLDIRDKLCLSGNRIGRNVGTFRHRKSSVLFIDYREVPALVDQ